MENEVHSNDAAETAVLRAPPPPPSPTDAATAKIDPSYSDKSNEPLKLDSEQWDIRSISAWAALRMLEQALETLAETTGNIPPTPPVSRPTTPNKEEERELHRVISPEICIGSPEAHPHEPITPIGGDAPDISVQHAAIARRFFSKSVPKFSLEDYLHRIHHYCPHSPGVYLAAAAFCHRLCVAELKVPATSRTVHRLALVAIRIAAKVLEDNKWKQDYMAHVAGISLSQLMRLEVAFCYLLDFDLWVDEHLLASRMFLLQQAARQGMGSKGRLRDSFHLKLPLRKKMIMQES